MSNNAQNYLVTKASGELLPFSKQKLKKSLLRAGATEEIAQDILDEITPRLYEGVSTKKIYQWAFRSLKGKSKHLAAKYNLKRGIMQLGPSGFPFEKFVARLLANQGYVTSVGQIVNGLCVSHEIDIIAEKDTGRFMIECKYHNHQGTICDVKIPLYVQSRFKDVESTWLKLQGQALKVYQGWIVTNTRFTTDAVKYAACAGLHLIGWDYPNGNSLKEQVDKLGLYPVTCLTSLNKSEKEWLLAKKVVMCVELRDNDKMLQELGVGPSRLAVINNEIKRLCATVGVDPLSSTI